MKLLRRLKIGRKTFRVFYGYLRKEHGRISFSRRTIRLDDPQPPLVRLDATLHELLHGIWEAQALPDRVAEETAVTALGTGLATVFHDNPGLLQHFQQLLKDASR